MERQSVCKAIITDATHMPRAGPPRRHPERQSLRHAGAGPDADTGGDAVLVRRAQLGGELRDPAWSGQLSGGTLIKTLTPSVTLALRLQFEQTCGGARTGVAAWDG